MRSTRRGLDLQANVASAAVALIHGPIDPELFECLLIEVKSFALENDIAIPVDANCRKVAELCFCMLRRGPNDVEVFHADNKWSLIRSG